MTRLQFLRKLVGSSCVVVAALLAGVHKAFARTCPECGGDGKCIYCFGKGDKQCPNCSGTGRVETFKAGVGIIFVMCSRCFGSGRIDCYHCSGTGLCLLCHGTGLVPDEN